MRFSDLLSMSVNNLRRRKLRTFLTVLGVVIGTASIVVMVSLGILRILSVIGTSPHGVRIDGYLRQAAVGGNLLHGEFI